jgi:hypothetical protein
MVASQIYHFTVTVPAGTPITSPSHSPMSMPVSTVEWIEWDVPPGSNGKMGFFFASHGQQVIPFTDTGPNWIVTAGRDAHWDLTDQMDSGDWETVGYNTGIYLHRIFVRFGLAVPLPARGATLPPIPIENLGP